MIRNVIQISGEGNWSRAIRFVQDDYEEWKRMPLITPVAKQENVRFYTEKCGFQIASTERDGKVELVRFLPERLLESSQASVKGTGEHERLQFVF